MWSSAAPMKAIIAFGMMALMTASRVVTAQECQAQGQESCQLYLTGHTTNDWVYWDHATIYNYKCDVIGGKDTITSGMAISSQLPYLVIIDSVRHVLGDISVIGFRYADYSFHGSFWCAEDWYDGRPHYRCIHAFRCDQK